jgi:hypothetical protein
VTRFRIDQPLRVGGLFSLLPFSRSKHKPSTRFSSGAAFLPFRLEATRLSSLPPLLEESQPHPPPLLSAAHADLIRGRIPSGQLPAPHPPDISNRPLRQGDLEMRRWDCRGDNDRMAGTGCPSTRRCEITCPRGRERRRRAFARGPGLRRDERSMAFPVPQPVFSVASRLADAS